jgi:hypothetical protein
MLREEGAVTRAIAVRTKARGPARRARPKHLPATSLISTTKFRVAYAQSAAIRHVMQVHARALLLQLQHVAACLTAAADIA